MPRIDPYAGFMRDAVVLVDSRIEELEYEAKDHPDPDSFGLLDSFDYICGYGFVALQAYMTGINGLYKINKSRSLDLGPIHRNGRTMASLVNGAANYWKHADDPGPQFQRCVETLESLGIVVQPGNYPLMGSLYEMVAPHDARFVNLLPFMEQWKESIP